MAQYSILKSFYGSEKWQKFRKRTIADRGAKCETCRKITSRQGMASGTMHGSLVGMQTSTRERDLPMT